MYKPLCIFFLVLLVGCSGGQVLVQPVVLFAIGDTGHCQVEGTARVSAAVHAQPDVARVVLVEVGDLAYPVATQERLLACHEPYWGDFKRRLAVPGNHEWHDPDAAGFFSVFPDPVPRKVGLGGPWHVLLLDSNLKKEAWDAQIKWLDATLAASSGECLIAAWHHPRWSSGRHGDNPATQPLWERLQGKAVLTLHGHDHHFEALSSLDSHGEPHAQGTPSFIVGNGGAPLYKAGPRIRSKRVVFGQWGFLRMELDGMAYRWQEIDTDGTVRESGEGVCRPNPT
ncbi:MAG: metallophosphoesterase [Magnetococcales bacterium]|nr:metallophosphoesterase [Magnetococcales bacterium]MBF0322324.1 metallophosphoesterase [Magnetococcales bacterium]